MGVGLAIVAFVASAALAIAVIAWARARANDVRVERLEDRADRASLTIHAPLGDLARTLTEWPSADPPPKARGPPDTKRSP